MKKINIHEDDVGLDKASKEDEVSVSKEFEGTLQEISISGFPGLPEPPSPGRCQYRHEGTKKLIRKTLNTPTRTQDPLEKGEDEVEFREDKLEDVTGGAQEQAAGVKQMYYSLIWIVETYGDMIFFMEGNGKV